MKFKIIPTTEFPKISSLRKNHKKKYSLISDMCRYNTLVSVKKAGSGHLGSSFSAMDIIVYLYYEKMNLIEVGLDSPDRDIYFSSKGHDVPGLYSLLYGLGILPLEKILMLRRLGGVDGHPEKHTPGIEANSGSLGMGISKARGMAWAKKYKNNKGKVYVMTGDGELQEGQIYEALHSTISQGITNLIVIVDYNKYQTDNRLENIISLGDLNKKFKSFGWYVDKFNGHDFGDMKRAFDLSDKCTDKPKILIADTIKGKGISFMEPREDNEYYEWHSGAPDDESFHLGVKELLKRINRHCKSLDIPMVGLIDIEEKKKNINNPISSEYVANGFGEELIELANDRKDIVVLDGDLSADCRIRKFEKLFPKQFIENGIAEQDMVSMAGGLASQGLLPIVNSFASFLASRPNEQIYNNAAEKTKIIYACHFAGIIPAGPGKSHQSVRDISLFTSLPNVTIFQPSSTLEARLGLQYFVNEETGVCVLRMNIGPSPKIISPPENYRIEKGKGFIVREGKDLAVIAYGPVMISEVLIASEVLSNYGVEVKVINMPWLNCIDSDWLLNELESYEIVYVVDDHSIVGGLGDHIISNIQFTEAKLIKLGIKDFPNCGNPLEVLKSHQLDGQSIANLISIELNKPSISNDKYESIDYIDNAPQ